MFHTVRIIRTSLSSTRGQSPSRGLTLVEMLISMAVTLVMMAAVVNLFANIGAGVRNRRASMELGTQLRTARARLFKDLAGATSFARPKLPSDDHDDGYLEIIEGNLSDKNPSLLLDWDPMNGELDYATSLVPSGGDPAIVFPASSPRIVEPNDATNGGALGDYDDVLALTVRSESEPFTGRMPVWRNNQWEFDIIESDLAEVIWYAVENPDDGSFGEPGLRTVYRRVLLIAPWVQEFPAYKGGATGGQTPIDLDRVCYQLSDVSFRREGNIRVANTLSDLTKRENRFAHFRNIFPHALDVSAIRNNTSTTRNNFPEVILNGSGDHVRPILHPFGLPFEWDEPSDGTQAAPYDPSDSDNDSPPSRAIGESFLGSDRTGEDVMLNDVLAFDLRVFDPNAPLFLYQNTVLEPTNDNFFTTVVNNGDLAGVGAYVDLGWDDSYDYDYTAFPGVLKPHFQEERMPGYHPRDPGRNIENNLTGPPSVFRGTPAVYDAWPYHYESDGLDQDDTTDNDNVPDGDALTGAIDEGTDGLDSDGNNGVDDSLEREAPPPYDHPLRAMQAKIRIYDRDSRQIREATVTRNFVPQ